MNDAKRIPYGVSNFVEVVEQNQYYVDKTMYLPLLEKQPSSLFFIRPRRFGKSIFLSMLRAYYDISQKEKFQKRFGDLWIGSRPTPLQGAFQILFLDFSRIAGIDGTLALAPTASIGIWKKLLPFSRAKKLPRMYVPSSFRQPRRSTSRQWKTAC